MELIIWTLQLLINGYFYRKYLTKQIAKFQKKIRWTVHFYFIALIMTIFLSVICRILRRISGLEDEVDAISKIVRILDTIKYPMLNLVDVTLIDFGLKLIIVEAQVFVQAKSADQVMRRYERARYF